MWQDGFLREDYDHSPILLLGAARQHATTINFPFPSETAQPAEVTFPIFNLSTALTFQLSMNVIYPTTKLDVSFTQMTSRTPQ